MEGAAIHFLGNDESAGFPSNVRVFNNIAIAGEGRAVLRVVPGALTQNNTFDHNNYFSTSRLRMIWGEKEITDFETFRKTSGQEAHGLVADPRLRGAGKAGLGRLPLEEYRLLPDSPNLKAGTDYLPDLGPLDYWGKALNAPIKMNIGPQQ